MQEVFKVIMFNTVTDIDELNDAVTKNAELTCQQSDRMNDMMDCILVLQSQIKKLERMITDMSKRGLE